MKTKSVGKKFWLETEYRKSGETVSTNFEEDVIGGVLVSDKHCVADAKLGLTVSLGNYEFLRVDAGVSIPCEKDGIKAAHEEAFMIVGSEVFKRAEEAKKTLK